VGAADVKGCLVIIGFLVVSVAVAVGITITVLRVNASKNAPLTQQTTELEYTTYEPETHSGRSGTSGHTSIPGANVEYRYRAEGRWFASPERMWLPSSRLSGVVCFDPDDPAVHAMRGDNTACGKHNGGTVRRARAVAP
jgi:hypothetical protein